MRLNLGPISVIRARSIVFWCHEHGVDMDKIRPLYDMWRSVDRAHPKNAGISLAGENIVIDVPDKYVTYFTLQGWL